MIVSCLELFQYHYQETLPIPQKCWYRKVHQSVHQSDTESLPLRRPRQQNSADDTKTCCGSARGRPARNDRKVNTRLWLYSSFHSAFIHLPEFKLLTGDNPEKPQSAPQTHRELKTLCNTHTHTHTHTHIQAGGASSVSRQVQ